MGNKIISQVTWIMILVVIVSKRGKAIVDIKPTDTVVILKGSTFFNCSTFNFTSSSEEIAWYHYSVSSNQRRDVYEDGEIRTNYESRFRVEKDLSKGVVNLIVQAPTLEDAGTYECQDGKGIGETARAQLIVLETKPVCQSKMQPDGVIGSNDCGIPPDQVEMSCSITYRGNIPVHLEWRNGLENDNSPLTVECSNTTNRSTCNLTVTGDRTRNNSAYICSTKNTGTNAYNCSSDVIRILYVMSDNATISKSDLDEYRCSVNSSQQCTYTWSSGDGTIVSTSESLKPTQSGQYLCKAYCNIRGQTCIVTARNLNVSVETTNEGSNTAPIIAGVVVPLFVIAATIIFVIVALHLYKKQKERRDGFRAQSQLPPQPINGRPSEEIVPLQVRTQDEVDSDDDAIRVAFNNAPYIDKGLSGGEIHGPLQYKGRQCAYTCERITCTNHQQTQTSEGEMTKEQKIYTNSQKWMELTHINLRRIYEVISKSPFAYIMMEYAAGGSVRDALKKCTEDLPPSVVKDWATQIAQGMEYLHEKGIVHKNLNSVQILIMESFEASDVLNKSLKISQFCLIDDNFTRTQVEQKFSFKAPEVFDGIYDKEGDVWSFGIVIWEMLTKRIPYEEHKALDKIVNDIRQGATVLKIADSCPKALEEILKDCRRLNLSERPSFCEIVERLQAWQVVSSPA